MAAISLMDWGETPLDPLMQDKRYIHGKTPFILRLNL